MNKSNALTIIKPLKPPTNLKTLGNALARAKTPEAVLDFERQVAAYESYMRKAGFSQGDLHEVNEARMRARWRLGQMLAAITRANHRPKKGVRAAPLFRETLDRLGLERKRAIEAQRLGMMPKIELEKLFRKMREIGDFATITWLVNEAYPYWYKERREQRHEDIKSTIRNNSTDKNLDPFPLIYADPPWHFKTYTEDGGGRLPHQHYPTLQDDDIKDFKVGGRLISEIAHKDAMLFLWCTSSNIPLALEVMEAWDFTFKASAAWDKELMGTGHIFRNQHEVLLYGDRGKVPGPVYVPPSLFRFRRGKHSAKPPEIRKVLERMYPKFTKDHRIELFARGSIPGWTTDGFES